MRLIFGTVLFMVLSVTICAQPATTSCPEITVTGPSGATNGGDLMRFTASIRNGPPGKIDYDWSITAGVIESGQGTATIKVRTTKEMAGTNVTAMVKIRNVEAGCADTAWEIAGVAFGIVCYLPLDDFGKLSKNDVKARIVNLFIRLNSDPDSEGLILVYLNTKESRAFKLTYLNNLYDAILFLKYDPARVTFIVVQDDRDTVTRLWTIPPGADIEKLTEGGVLIKGEEFKQKIKTLFSKQIK